MAILNSSIITGSLNVTGNIYAVNSVYENGTALVDKYLGKTAKAADSSKLDGHGVSYFITTAGDTQTKDGSLIIRGNTTFGPSVPNSRTGVTQEPTYLCRASFDRNASALAAFFPYTGIGDWFYAADKKPNFIIRSTFQGIGTDADVYNANFYTWGQAGGERLQNLFNWKYGDGWQCLPSKISASTPAIIEIKSTTLLTYTDVLRLFITGHNGDRGGQAYSGSLTDYQIDVCTDYANDTWKTVVQRSGVSDAIGNTPVYALQIPKTGSETTDYTPFYGLRLTIRGATAGSGWAYIKISTIQVRDYRPAFTVSDAVGAVSMNGGEMYGNLWLKGASSNQCIGPNVTNTCRLGDGNHRWNEIHGNTIYENGTTLSNKYLGKTAKAADADKLDGQDSTYFKALVETTWASLKSLRDSGQLVPGQQYRITDYQCTTTQTNTSSAGHQFDIIVVADDSWTLNEKARAVAHVNDGYFDDNNLNAWQLWYCLDNDTSRFAWADTTDGKGVIYRMIDEFNNDLPYDFKNIKYRGFGISEMKKYGAYLLSSMTRDEANDVQIDGTIYYAFLFTITSGPSGSGTYYTATLSPTNSSDWYSISGDVATVTSDVRLRMLSSMSLGQFYYTFDYIATSTDQSLSDAVRNNSIKPWLSNDHVQLLNHCIIYENNPLSPLSCYGNVIESGFHDNVISGGGAGFHDNRINHYFYNNLIVGSFYDNQIGHSAFGNRFGTGFINNAVCDSVIYNVFGIEFRDSKIGCNVRNCLFGTDENSDYRARNLEICTNVQHVNLACAEAGEGSIQNVTLHSGIAGTSSSILTITVPNRNITYTLDYYANNSQSIILD